MHTRTNNNKNIVHTLKFIFSKPNISLCAHPCHIFKNKKTLGKTFGSERVLGVGMKFTRKVTVTNVDSI